MDGEGSDWEWQQNTDSPSMALWHNSRCKRHNSRCKRHITVPQRYEFQLSWVLVSPCSAGSPRSCLPWAIALPRAGVGHHLLPCPRGHWQRLQHFWGWTWAFDPGEHWDTPKVLARWCSWECFSTPARRVSWISSIIFLAWQRSLAWKSQETW